MFGACYFLNLLSFLNLFLIAAPCSYLFWTSWTKSTLQAAIFFFSSHFVDLPVTMLSAYYCWRPVYDGYECLQLLEQNGGFGNNGAQPPMQIHNVHNSAGEFVRKTVLSSLCVWNSDLVKRLLVFGYMVSSLAGKVKSNNLLICWRTTWRHKGPPSVICYAAVYQLYIIT